jgi:hypothetical protein
MEVTPPPTSLKVFTTMPGVKGVTSTIDEERSVARLKFVVEKEEALDDVTSAISSAKLKVLSSWRQEPTLEEVFVNLVGSGFAEREMENAG